MSRILIIDDQLYLEEFFSEEMMDEGYGVLSVGDAESVRAYIEDSKPDLVLLEPSLQGFEGWGVLEDIKSNHPNLPVLIVTAYDSYENDPRVSQADGYVVKNFADVAKFKKMITDLLGRGPANRA